MKRQRHEARKGKARAPGKARKDKVRPDKGLGKGKAWAGCKAIQGN